MKIHLMPLFIPVLFAIVYCEWQYSKNKNLNAFKTESSILNMACGVMERIFDLYFFVLLYFFFAFIEKQVGLVGISIQSPFAWISCIILLDFVIYWFHRSGHSINLLWGAHVTHHQCEEFNLTVAFRNSVFPHIFRSFYMLILPIIGFPAEMIISSLMISGIWQFFIHTQTINKLGILETFMMTPSHHRVHHGSNPEYIDKNFGGMLIIWDKLFGTFQEEIVEVKYGITSPLNSWNPVRAYTHVWRDLYKVSSSKNNIFSKLKIWFGKPGDFYNRYKKVDSGKKETRRNKIPVKLLYYIFFQFVIVIAVLISFLVYNEFYNIFIKIALAIFINGSAIGLCTLMESHPNIFRYEKIRILSLAALPLIFQSWPLLILAIILIPVSLIWVTVAQEHLILLNPGNNKIKKYQYL